MKRLFFLLFIFSTTFIFSDSPDASPPVLSMWINASDIVAGECGLSGWCPPSLFGLMIENHSSSPVRLASDSDINAIGPWWKLNAEGPMDSRCLEISKNVAKVFVQHSPGWVPFLEIPPHSVKRVSIGPYDKSTPGFYTLNAEYDGTTAPEGCFKGMLKAKAKTFTVKAPTGVDLEIIQKWRQQNPDKPYCYFPTNMKPDILNTAILLAEFPDSSYAARVALGDFNSIQTWRQNDPYTVMQHPSPYSREEKASLEKYANVLRSIIDNRPDFQYITDVKIKYCLWLWSIDRRAECIENLRVWAKDKDDDLSNWAKKYLVAAERLQKEGTK
jgi:hypothetical protein